MRSLSIHPFSLATGLALGLTVMLSMGQVNPMSTKTLNVQYLPHPRDYVQIRMSVPYIVPPGKILVITGLGASDTAASTVSLAIDGQPELRTYTGQMSVDTPTVRPVPPGLTVQGGSTVVLAGAEARAWGYLAPQ